MVCSCSSASDSQLTTPADLPTLINHGLSALADTLQQDKHLTALNTAVSIIGPASEEIENVTGVGSSGATRHGYFRVRENDEVEPLLRAWRRSRGEPEDGPAEEAAATEGAAAGEGAAAPAAAEPAAAGEDVEMQ